MNVKNRQKILSILSVLLFVIAIGMFVWYEFAGGRTTLNYQRVIVLKEEVLQGNTIERSMLDTDNYEKESIQNNYITNYEDIVGQVAKHYIPAKTPLVSNYFEQVDLVLKDGQYVAQLPKEWIISVPQSLRRGDRVILYATNIDSEGPVTITTDENGQMIPKQSKPIENNSQIIELFETTVAFVKDSANTEVVTTSKEDRKDANSSIASVEIITTAEDFKKVEKEIKGEKRLIIMYTNSKSKDVEDQNNDDESESK